MGAGQSASETHGAVRRCKRSGCHRPYLSGLLLLVLLAGSAVGVAAEAAQVDARLDVLFGEHEPYRSCLRELQAAVSEQAREQVANMVSYPLRTRLKGQWVRLHTPAQFLVHYDELLTWKTQQAIAQQAYGDLFSNSLGVMIGNGELWFGSVCNDHSCSARSVKIIAINP